MNYHASSTRRRVVIYCCGMLLLLLSGCSSDSPTTAKSKGRHNAKEKDQRKQPFQPRPSPFTIREAVHPLDKKKSAARIDFDKLVAEQQEQSEDTSDSDEVQEAADEQFRKRLALNPNDSPQTAAIKRIRLWSEENKTQSEDWERELISIKEHLPELKVSVDSGSPLLRSG